MTKIIVYIKRNKKEITLFTLLTLITSFIFLCYYPGILTYDSNVQWNEVITGNLTNSHPFLSTYFMYLLSKIHETTTIVILYQIFLSALTITRIYKITREKNTNHYIEIISCIIIALIPIISIYTITLWKDIIYSYYLINYGIYLYEWDKSKYNFKNYKYIIMALLLFLVFNYRLNGMIVATLLLILTFIIMIRKKINKKVISKYIIAFLIFNLILMIPKNYYLSKVEKDNSVSIGTLNSYMIWIYGGYLNSNVEMEKDEKDFLNKIADTKNWGNIYSGYLINHTNMMDINKEYLLENNKKFRKYFLKTTIDNPLEFIKHYLRADSLLIAPITHGYIYSYDFSDWGEESNFDSKTTPVIKGFNNIYDKIINFTLNCKYINILHNPANILYLSIILVVVLNIIDKTKKYTLVILPMLFNTISLLPINIAQDLRYVYINYLTLVFIIILILNKIPIIIKKIRKKEKKYEKNIVNYPII